MNYSATRITFDRLHIQLHYPSGLVYLVSLQNASFTGMLPPDLGALQQLSYFSVSDNTVSGEVPSGFELLSVKALEITNPQLKKIMTGDMSFKEIAGFFILSKLKKSRLIYRIHRFTNPNEIPLPYSPTIRLHLGYLHTTRSHMSRDQILTGSVD